VAASDYFDLLAGRKCPEWFAKAGLSDLKVQIKVFKIEHPSAENMELSFLDFMPSLEDANHPLCERYRPIFAQGFLDTARARCSRQSMIILDEEICQMINTPEPPSPRTLDTEIPELKPFLKPGMTVLDVGCGFGTITLDVANTVKPGQVVGIDPSAHRVDVAREWAAANPQAS
jgi:SAM-dependent methyltransferase